MAVHASYHDHEGHSHRGHGHGHALPDSTRALGWALAVTLLFAGVEAAGGLAAGSLALLADAAHMVMDAAALGLALFAAWMARKPAGGARTYGWYRLEILAALAFGKIMETVLTDDSALVRGLGGDNRLAAVVIGGASMGVAAALVAFVHDEADDRQHGTRH